MTTMTRVCAQCKNFIGLGDFNLCCSKKYGLTYENSEADDCDYFEQEMMCKNVSKVVGGFRCSICGGYSDKIEKDQKYTLEQLVDASIDSANEISKMVECPYCHTTIVKE